MTQPDAHSEDQIRRLAQRIDPRARLIRAWPLSGGVSATLTAFELALPDGGTSRLVVRRHGAVDLQNNPRIAADEYRLLELLHTAGIAVPRPYAVDESGDIFPAPVVVIEYIDGATDFNLTGDAVDQLAEQLLRIHRITPSTHDLSFLPHQAQRHARMLRERPARLDESIDEGRIRDALAAYWPVAQPNPAVLLHGDYWPGNVLWQAGRIAAVIDWEDAQTGDPLVDLANTRLELLWAAGDDAMQRFTAAYLAAAQIDATNLPYWDLRAAIRPAFKIAEWATDEQHAHTMLARHRRFTGQAFEQLARVRRMPD